MLSRTAISVSVSLAVLLGAGCQADQQPRQTDTPVPIAGAQQPPATPEIPRLNEQALALASQLMSGAPPIADAVELGTLLRAPVCDSPDMVRIDGSNGSMLGRIRTDGGQSCSLVISTLPSPKDGDDSITVRYRPRGIALDSFEFETPAGMTALIVDEAHVVPAPSE